MAQLPKFYTTDPDLSKLVSNWSAALNPVLAHPLLSGAVLKQVTLVTGSNAINHKLGRALAGYMVVRQRAAAAIYDAQDSNSMPDKTLVLVSDAPVVIDLYVF